MREHAVLATELSNHVKVNRLYQAWLANYKKDKSFTQKELRKDLISRQKSQP